jgi:hypothetical protein
MEIGGVEDNKEKENEKLVVAKGLFELLSRQPYGTTLGHLLQKPKNRFTSTTHYNYT